MNKFSGTIICFLVLVFSCNPKSKTDIESEMVMVNTLDSAGFVQEYIDRIRTFPEFQSWSYNSNASNSREEKGYHHFESRLLTIGKNKFYHIELFKTKSVPLTSSYLPAPELVAYFRVDAYKHSIKIIDVASNTFLDFRSTEGRTFFKKCLLLP